MTVISKFELEETLSTSETFFLLDVREPEEFDDGHLPKAILAPWHDINQKTSGIPHGTPLILYCNTGVRAQKAAKLLEQSGFTNISVYPGGWAEWTS
jgi:rhodanese-related sulfurtransferase